MMEAQTIPWIVYGTAWKKERTAELTHQAVLQGFRAVDTANQPKHYQEPLVGEGLLRAAKEGIHRKDLFLQTKFTPLDGQDHRVPYDPNADLKTQVNQSFASSLEHLHTDYVDSYLLHGPYHHPGLGEEDWVVWKAMEEIHRSGRARQIGIANVNAVQLELLIQGASTKPSVVQNRCFADRGWDKEIREICRAHQITYQGFSLLTANPQVVQHPHVKTIASHFKVSPEQIVFGFARELGMVALTGTTNVSHMSEDLKAEALSLEPSDIQWIESIAV